MPIKKLENLEEKSKGNPEENPKRNPKRNLINVNKIHLHEDKKGPLMV